MLTTIEDKMEEVATPTEKENNNLKETTETTTESEINDQNDYSYSYEQDPSLKTLMNNFDNTILIDSFQNQCLQFDTERLMNVNPTFFYNDEVFNPENYEITSKELFEKLVKDRTAFMNILLIDLSIYSNFSICGAQVFPNLKQTCIKLKDITDFIEIKKELYNACYLVFEDQWDRKDNSSIVVFDDDGKSQFARAFTEICIEGQWGSNVYMLKDGILSFMKDYPILCVSEEFNEENEYDDDDDDDDYYYNEGLYKTIQDSNNLNEKYTNTIEMVDINENNTYNNEYTNNNQDIDTIFNPNNLVNDITFTTSNSAINDVDMTNISPYQTNDITTDNNIPSINNISISIENDYDMNTSNFTNNINEIEDIKIEQVDKKRKIEKLEEEKENITKNEEEISNMDYEESKQINKNEQEQNMNNMVMDININNNNNENTIKTENSNENTINSSSEINTENNDISTSVLTENNNITVTNSEIESRTGNEENKVSDSMACYDPRQMATVNIDTNNKLIKNNQTEEIIKLRKFQRYLIHNVWYAMDNSNDVPLMVCPPFLYLGSLYTSQEHHLINYNIKHIIRLGTDFNISYSDPSKFNFYNFDIFDLPKEPIKELFQKANEIIEQARLNHENVLVHCHAGVSRSSTIILAYLMRYKGMTLYDAWCSTFKIRPIIRPNDGFAIALQEYEKMLFGFDQPTMPVVGMSNSYLFSIEYFDFISRLEEMHKLDSNVPVFRPEKTYDDLLKEVEEEEAKDINNLNETSNESTTDDMKEEINEEKSSMNNETNNGNENENVNSKNDENQNNDSKTEKKESEKSETINEKNDVKKTYHSNNVDHNNTELDKTDELKNREE